MMENVKKVLSPELHELLCTLVKTYVENAQGTDKLPGKLSSKEVLRKENFETIGRTYFDDCKSQRITGRSLDRRAHEAFSILSSDPSALYKLVECDPDVLYLRDKMKFLVLSYLLNKPQDLVKFGADYFRDSRNTAELGAPSIDGQTPVVVYEKSPEQYRQLRNKIQHALLFRSLDDSQMNQVLSAMFKLNVKQGSYVIRQGDEGDYFYVVDDGVFEAYVKDGRGVNQKVSTYKGNGSFGELALLYNMPRVATVKAVTDGALWCLDRDSFRKIVVRSAYEKRQIYEGFISKVPALKVLSDYEKQILADALQPLTYEDGECIIRQGDEAVNGVYFVEEGTVMFSHTNRDGRVTKLNKIAEGGYFGELAILGKKPRAASAFALGRVRLAFIDKESFERLLGPCKSIMQRNATSYENLN